MYRFIFTILLMDEILHLSIGKQGLIHRRWVSQILITGHSPVSMAPASVPKYAEEWPIDLQES